MENNFPYDDAPVVAYEDYELRDLDAFIEQQLELMELETY